MPGKKKLEDKENTKPKKDETDNEEYEQEKLGSKVLLAVVTLLIVVIWLGIIALLIKMDVGGFGSSVLYPVLKDVPYINKILPENENTTSEEVDTQYKFASMDEAVARIKELELMLADSQQDSNDKQAQIDDLQSQNQELQQYKDEQADFELLKEKFYEEVVFSDNAPDINEYKTYYESIDPKNAEVLYKQVVEQITYDDEVKDYADTYSKMKPKEAAAIFDTMTDNLGLVADIMKNMGTEERGKILGKMDATTAAKLTEIMEPTK